MTPIMHKLIIVVATTLSVTIMSSFVFPTDRDAILISGFGGQIGILIFFHILKKEADNGDSITR